MDQIQSLILAEIIEFNPGSLPIKTTVRKTTDDVSAVSFASDDVFNTKTASEDIWIQLLEGSVEILVDGVQHQLSSGQSLTVPAGMEKTIKNHTAFKLISAHIQHHAI